MFSLNLRTPDWNPKLKKKKRLFSVLCCIHKNWACMASCLSWNSHITVYTQANYVDVSTLCTHWHTLAWKGASESNLSSKDCWSTKFEGSGTGEALISSKRQPLHGANFDAPWFLVTCWSAAGANRHPGHRPAQYHVRNLWAVQVSYKLAEFCAPDLLPMSWWNCR